MIPLNKMQETEIDELNEFLRDVLGVDPIEEIDELSQPEIRGRFKIKTLDQVNWAFRKMAALKAEQANIEALAKSEIERINSWKTSKLEASKQSLSFFEFIVAEYAETKKLSDPKYKGDSTPYGKIGFRKQQAEWKYPEEERAAEWLEEVGKHNLVKVERTIKNKTEFKKAVDIKRNVFVNGGEVVDVATIGEDGLPVGMQYAVHIATVEDGQPVGWEIIDTETGEIAAGVGFEQIVVVVDGVKVVPGIVVSDRPESIEIKPEA